MTLAEESARIDGRDGSTPVVRLTSVSRTYPGPPPVLALRPCDLTVLAGDYLAITGPSGSGKTTFLNLVGLLDRPSAGQYELDGVDVSKLSEAHRSAFRGNRVGLVFQSFNLLPYRSALENVIVAQTYNGTPRHLRRSQAIDALGLVGLRHRIDAAPTTMSGGERQRVAIARAVVNMPALLLCDEPTGNLDSTNTRAVMSLFDDLNSRGLTIVTITHEPDVARRARRQVTIKDGWLSE